jgi:6-pyruvoyltetrahydropterin/6-carboxytetrahydropterin synthase
MEIFREFTFDAAHRLDNLPPGHKCANLHGHTYHLTVHCDGPIDPRVGWVIDFAELKRIVHAAIDRLDHAYLNDIPGLEQPTAERIAVWLWDRIAPNLPTLTRITLRENTTSGVTYGGPDA